MQFLILTNVKNVNSDLNQLQRQFGGRFDFIIHSNEEYDEHHSDLRNLKNLDKHISDETIVVFYLTGNLALYVIDEFFKKFGGRKNRIIYLYSALNDFLDDEFPAVIINKAALKIIKLNANSYISLPVLLTEEAYFDDLKKSEKKYFVNQSYLNSLVIPREKLFKEALNISEDEDALGKTIYLVNDNLNTMNKSLMKILKKELKFYRLKKPLLSFVSKLIFINTPTVYLHSLLKLINELPNLIQVKVSTDKFTGQIPFAPDVNSEEYSSIGKKQTI